jgi:hypothetical protein
MDVLLFSLVGCGRFGKRNRALVRESDGDDSSCGMTSIIWKRYRGRRILLADHYYMAACVSQGDQVFMGGVAS